MPRKGMSPLVQKRIDCVMFVHGCIERNHEARRSPSTTAECVTGQPGPPHDHWHCRRAVFPQSSQHGLENATAGSTQKARLKCPSLTATTPDSPRCAKAEAVAAENSCAVFCSHALPPAARVTLSHPLSVAL